MSNQEKLVNRLEEAQQHLNGINDDLAFHIKEDHQGKPPTSCHRCNNLKSRRLFAIEDVDASKLRVGKLTGDLP